MVKNDRNLVSRDKGQRSSFTDDCGIWDSSKGSSPRTYFMTLPDSKLKAVYEKGDKFFASQNLSPFLYTAFNMPSRKVIK